MSAVSSPQTKAPAPSLILRSKAEIRTPGCRRPRRPVSRISPIAFFKPLDGQRILGPDVDVSLGGADRIGRDEHPLQDGMGVALDQRAVHEGARVAFVGVADEIALVALRFPAGLPFPPGRETGAAAAAQAGPLDGVQDLLPGHGQALFEPPIPVPGQVMVEIVRVDDAAVPKHDPHLRLEHRQVEEAGDSVEVRLPEMPGEVVLPGPRRFSKNASRSAGTSLGRDVGIADPRPARHLDIHERLQVARSDAAHRNDPAVDPAAFRGIPRAASLRLGRPGRQTAGGRADVDERTAALLELLPFGRRPACGARQDLCLCSSRILWIFRTDI